MIPAVETIGIAKCAVPSDKGQLLIHCTLGRIRDGILGSSTRMTIYKNPATAGLFI
jgi:hypothetical protein